MSNTQIQRTVSAFAIAGTFAFAAWFGTAIADAEPVETINLSDVHDIDSLPACRYQGPYGRYESVEHADRYSRTGADLGRTNAASVITAWLGENA